MADVGAPDQTGGPTWGAIAVPSQMSTWNPGATVLGELATDTAQNAKRAQNLAAFDAYQKMNPGATAADLSSAADRIFGGSNWLSGNLGASGVMQSIAQKNQLALAADQSKQQSQVDATIQQALDTAAQTANTTDDWIKQSKALLPQSSWGAFDAYVGPQNTGQMFSVFQQRRIQPVVDLGVAHLWDTKDQYRWALGAGASDALVDMAYNMAKPKVDAAKQVAADVHGVQQADIGLKQGQRTEALAGAGARVAEAGVYRAQTVKLNQETADEQTKAAIDRRTDFNTIISDPAVIKAIQTQDPANIKQAHDAAWTEWQRAHPGTDPKEFDAMWANAPFIVSGVTQARVQALATQSVESKVATTYTPLTDTARSSVESKDTGYLGTNPALYTQDAAGKQQMTRAQELIRSTLANKTMLLTDAEAMKKIVHDGIVAGKTDDQIRSDLTSATGKDGYKVLSETGALKNALYFREKGTNIGPTNTEELETQAHQQVLDLNTGMDKLISDANGYIVKGANQKPQLPNFKNDVDTARNQIDTLVANLNQQIYNLQDPDTTGIYWGKDKTPDVIAKLVQERDALLAKAGDLKRVTDMHPELMAAGTAADAGASITIGNFGPVKVNTDLSTLGSFDAKGIPLTVQETMDWQRQQQQNVSRFGVAAAPGPAGIKIDPDFISLLNQDTSQSTQLVTALALNEGRRILGSLQQPAQKQFTATGYKRAPDTGQPPTQLTLDQAQALTLKVLGANQGRFNQDTLKLIQENLPRLILLQQARELEGQPQ